MADCDGRMGDGWMDDSIRTNRDRQPRIESSLVKQNGMGGVIGRCRYRCRRRCRRVCPFSSLLFSSLFFSLFFLSFFFVFFFSLFFFALCRECLFSLLFTVRRKT